MILAVVVAVTEVCVISKAIALPDWVKVNAGVEVAAPVRTARSCTVST